MLHQAKKNSSVTLAAFSATVTQEGKQIGVGRAPSTSGTSAMSRFLDCHRREE
jgi:hypothetical protein